ncbi:hypothetical protein REPUB_Repub12eG0186300 [Reevesia pubescens]
MAHSSSFSRLTIAVMEGVCSDSLNSLSLEPITNVHSTSRVQKLSEIMADQARASTKIDEDLAKTQVLSVQPSSKSNIETASGLMLKDGLLGGTNSPKDHLLSDVNSGKQPIISVASITADIGNSLLRDGSSSSSISEASIISTEVIAKELRIWNTPKGDEL